MIIYNKTRQLFYVSVDSQTFLGLEMTSNLRDTFSLSDKDKESHKKTKTGESKEEAMKWQITKTEGRTVEALK